MKRKVRLGGKHGRASQVIKYKRDWLSRQYVFGQIPHPIRPHNAIINPNTRKDIFKQMPLCIKRHMVLNVNQVQQIAGTIVIIVIHPHSPQRIEFQMSRTHLGWTIVLTGLVTTPCSLFPPHPASSGFGGSWTKWTHREPPFSGKRAKWDINIPRSTELSRRIKSINERKM